MILALITTGLICLSWVLRMQRETDAVGAKSPVWPADAQKRANDASDCRRPVEATDIKVGVWLIL